MTPLKLLNIRDYPASHPVAKTQLKRMDDLAVSIRPDAAHVSHTHVSKSITLPVATYEWTVSAPTGSPRSGSVGRLTMMVRDNFHDLSLFVSADRILQVPLDLLYQQEDFAWYRGQIERKRNYSYRGWTNEEMEDPRILRVRHARGHWCEVKGDVKDRWHDRMSSTEWYHRDWSSTRLVALGPNPFNEDTVFYVVPFSHGEGIPETTAPYTGPCSKFTQCLSDWDGVQKTAAKILKVFRYYVEQENRPVS